MIGSRTRANSYAAAAPKYLSDRETVLPTHPPIVRKEFTGPSGNGRPQLFSAPANGGKRWLRARREAFTFARRTPAVLISGRQCARRALPTGVLLDGENTFSRRGCCNAEHGRRARGAVVARTGIKTSCEVAGSIPAVSMIRWPAEFNFTHGRTRSLTTERAASSQGLQADKASSAQPGNLSRAGWPPPDQCGGRRPAVWTDFVMPPNDPRSATAGAETPTCNRSDNPPFAASNG